MGSKLVQRVAGVTTASVFAWAVTQSPLSLADNYETQSGRVLCAVTPDSTIDKYGTDVVACQGAFTQAPAPGYGAVVNERGTFQWVNGNLAIYSPTTQMVWGQTYHRGNWTIYHDQNGTTFTNDNTGHGMFVSIDNVYTF